MCSGQRSRCPKRRHICNGGNPLNVACDALLKAERASPPMPATAMRAARSVNAAATGAASPAAAAAQSCPTTRPGTPATTRTRNSRSAGTATGTLCPITPRGLSASVRGPTPLRRYLTGILWLLASSPRRRQHATGKILRGPITPAIIRLNLSITGRSLPCGIAEWKTRTIMVSWEP